MHLKFRKYKGSDNLYYFTLLNPAGEIILESSGFPVAENRDTAIAMAKQIALSDERYERCQSIRGTWFFNLRGTNTGIIGSSPMYETHEEMEAGITEVRSIAYDVLIPEESEISGNGL